MNNNISADFSVYLNRNHKEALIKQKGVVIWMTGLSGSGKTTIAAALEKVLHENGILSKVFDGDIIRLGLNKDLGFSNQDRTENIRRIAEVAKQFVDCGIVVICGFISPIESIRQMARNIIGENDFVEVFIDCPLNVCEQRDPKGLYKKARAGKIADFTGIDSPYETPANPTITINTTSMSVDLATKKIVEHIKPKIKY
jgi:adenylylsulfate kinase